MRISDWSSDVCSSDLSWHVSAVDQVEQVLPVAVLGQRPGERLELRGIDPSVVVGNLLRAAHAQALARLDGLDVVRCLQQRLVRARVEPRVAAAKERKSVVWGKSVSVRVDLGVRRIIKNKNR